MRFYKLYSPDNQRRYAEWDDVMQFIPLKYDCPLDSEHITSPHGTIPSVLHVVLPNEKVQDFVWTWYSECLVTNKTLAIFQEHELTGFTIKPVKVTAVKRGSLDNVPELHQICVTGWGGQATRESGITLTERCPRCGREQYGPISDWSKLIDVDKWDGSDFFVVWPMPINLFITERVEKIVKQYKLKGAKIIPLEEIDYHYDFTPGKLEDYYEKTIAEKRRRDFWL